MALTLRQPDRRTPSPRHSLAELDQLTRNLNQYLDLWRGSNGSDLFTPLADLEETDDAYLVDIEVPGIQRAGIQRADIDIDVEVSGRRLTVRGERKDKQRTGILRRRERVIGTFSCEVTLPSDVVEDDVSAELTDGVLIVRLPKPLSERPRRISIH